MNEPTKPARLFALCLSLFVSCGPTRHIAPSSADELSRFVLVIEEMPDGRVIDSWQPADDFDLLRYRYRVSEGNTYGRVMLVAAQKRDCHEEYLQCHRECKNSKLPPSHRHIPRGGSRHDSFCWGKCRQPYLDCEKLQELQPQEFTAMDGAVDWLKRNHKAVLAGSFIVIAGVVFVVVSAGTGVLVLAPIALVAA